MCNSSIVKIITLSICALCVVSQLYIPIPLKDVFHDAFSVPNASIVWISSSFGFAYASGFLIFGPLSDFFGRRALLVPGLAILGIITVSIASVSSFNTMIFLRIVQGLVAATFAPAALAYISEQIEPNLRTFGLSLVSTGFMMAGILGQIYAIQINLYFGLHAIFFISGITYIILSIFSAFILIEAVNMRHNNLVSLDKFYLSMLGHLKNIDLCKFYLCAFVLLLSFVAMYSGLGPYLMQEYHLNTKNMFLVRLAGIPGILIAPLASVYIKKYSSITILIAGFLIAAISTIGIAIFHNFWLIILMSSFFVAGISISAPALISSISAAAHSNRGSAVSLYTFVLFVGASLGTIFSSYLLKYGFDTLYWMIAIILLFSISSFLFKLLWKSKNELIINI